MKNNKGIFGRLLSIFGAILVVAGVFAFQGLSSADDSGAPADGGVGVTVPIEEDADDEDEQTIESEAETTYEYIVNYYKEVEVVDTETGEETIEYEQVDVQTYTGTDTERVFVVVETEPEGEGDFLGWFEKDQEKVGEYLKAGDELTLNAEKNTLDLVAKMAVLENYALRYDANGGMNAPGMQVGQSYFGDYEFVLSMTAPAREGYEFRGWKMDGDDSTVYAPGSTVKSEKSGEPLTLYAVWAEIRTFTLMYDVNGGTGTFEVQACKSANGQCGFTLATAMPTRSGFEFLGWQKGEETFEAGASITATETITILVASWKPIYNFTLNYVSEEGTEGLPDAQKCETVMDTCTFIVTTKEPTRNGYNFLGWRFEDKEEMLAKAGDELIVGVDGGLDLKIHAVWSKIYVILNSGEVFGAGERVVLRSSAFNGEFKGFTLDSEEVPAEYYALSEGETTSVVLSNAFSQSLSQGEHGFVITWANGEANGIISVNQNEDGTKRFVIVDGSGSTDGMSLMYRPKAGAVSKESSGIVADAATDNGESNFDAVRTLILVAVAAFVVIYLVNRFYVRRKMDFIEEF